MALIGRLKEQYPSTYVSSFSFSIFVLRVFFPSTLVFHCEKYIYRQRSGITGKLLLASFVDYGPYQMHFVVLGRNTVGHSRWRLIFVFTGL